MKNLLESSSNPLKLLDEHPQFVTEIIGINNLDCLKLFRSLITTSSTPTSTHLRARSTA